MNCKPGDLAIVVQAGNKENIGRVVKCVSIYTGGFIQSSTVIYQGNECWITEPKLRSWNGFSMAAGAPDEFLRPIRPDETPEQSIEVMKLLTQTKEKV